MSPGLRQTGLANLGCINHPFLHLRVPRAVKVELALAVIVSVRLADIIRTIEGCFPLLFPAHNIGVGLLCFVIGCARELHRKLRQLVPIVVGLHKLFIRIVIFSHLLRRLRQALMYRAEGTHANLRLRFCITDGTRRNERPVR